MVKKLIYIILVVSVIAGAYGYYLYNKPVEGMTAQKSAYTMSAADLFGAFSESESNANEQFLDKIIQLEGEVLKLETGESATSVYLNVNDPISSVICEMEAGQNISDLQEGQLIAVKGQCTGYLMDVVMVRCIIINSNK